MPRETLSATRVKTQVFVVTLVDLLLSCPSPFPSSVLRRRHSRTMTRNYQCWVYLFLLVAYQLCAAFGDVGVGVCTSFADELDCDINNGNPSIINHDDDDGSIAMDNMKARPSMLRYCNSTGTAAVPYRQSTPSFTAEVPQRLPFSIIVFCSSPPLLVREVYRIMCSALPFSWRWGVV